MTQVLDHGYVSLIGTWGSDESIIEAARMSTSKGFQGWGLHYTCLGCKRWYDLADGVHALGICKSCNGTLKIEQGDEKLLAYLYNHKHMTPFEMAGLTIEVQAPIFVFREWQRHRTQSYNELSARYTELPDLFYTPSVERMMQGQQSRKNKQGSEGGFTEEEARLQCVTIEAGAQFARKRYESLINAGVSRELARLVIPINQYSRMRASANLRNWLAFLTLRLDPAAQWEIRQFAGVVADLVKEHFPHTFTLFQGDTA